MQNVVALIGNLVREPELKYTPNGKAVVKFTLAVGRDFKNAAGERETDFIDCHAWEGTAEYLGNYATKGQPVAVTGSLRVNTWTDKKDGSKRKGVEVSVTRVQLLHRRSAADPDTQADNLSRAADDFSDAFADE